MALQDSQPENIRATLAVSEEEARLGGSRVINLPGGRSVTVTVPPGVRDGEEIRLSRQGDMGATEGAIGDLILRVSVIAVDAFRDDVDDASITQAAYTPPLIQPSPDLAAGHIEAAYTPAPAPSSMATPVPTEKAPGNYTPQPPAYQQAPAGGPQSAPGFGSYPNYPAPGQVVSPGQVYPQQIYPAYSPSLVPPQPHRRGGAITAVIVLLVLLLLVGSSLFFYFGYYQPGQVHIAATATAQARELGTANAQATGTAQIIQATARAAATSTAQVTATAQAQQSLYTSSTSGTPVLNDPLDSQTGSQWDESSSSSGSCTFTGGGYHSSIPTATFFQPCYAENTNFSNLAFQVDMTITQGDEGGILFRADSVNDKFYLFQIDVNGNYALYLYASNQGSQAVRLLRGSTTLMKGLGQLNEITLVAKGNALSFYLNKQYLNEVSDGTYSSGKIGVFAESVTQTTNAAFTNAKVWAL